MFRIRSSQARPAPRPHGQPRIGAWEEHVPGRRSPSGVCRAAANNARVVSGATALYVICRVADIVIRPC